MHDIHFDGNKSERYQTVLMQLRALAEDEDNTLALLANTTALLKQAFGWFWVGFYLVDRAGQNLTLGPFQGTVACTKIPKGRGVCGQAWLENQTLVVEDVNQHPNHIACSSLSQSEIVVPLYNRSGVCVGVLDVDSEHLSHFDAVDAENLRIVCDILSQIID